MPSKFNYIKNSLQPMQKSGKKLKDLIVEAKDDKYKLLVITHDDHVSKNETAPYLQKVAKGMGIECALADFAGMYMDADDEGPGKTVYHYKADKDGHPILPTAADDSDYDKPFHIHPDNTLIMARGLTNNGMHGNPSWWVTIKNLEEEGYTIINSTKCAEICNNKWYNQIIFQNHNFNTPKTVLIRNAEGAADAVKRLDKDFPMILKTAEGSQGVGVVWVESEKALHSITQVLHRENPHVDILLQEYIPTKYDVRVIIVGDEIIGSIKRPVIADDFRSNVSQGAEPEVHELTELEKSEALRAAKAVDGMVVGVDFIPAKNREKDKPHFIEVNSTPGLMGIEAAYKKSSSKPLVKEGSDITKRILEYFLNKDNWKKS